MSVNYYANPPPVGAKAWIKIYLRRGAKFLGVLLWTAVFGFLAADKVNHIYQADRTSRFPSIPGTIIKAELIPDPRAMAYNQPVVRFVYEINGRSTTGQQYRFGYARSLDDTESEDFRRRFHPGAPVKVFYDPDNLYNAALVAAPDGADLAVFVLFLPFNAATILFWAVMLRWLGRKLFKIPAGGVPIKQHRGETIARLPALTPAGLAGWTLIVGSFVEQASYFFLSSYFPVKENGLAWLLWLVATPGIAALAAYFWQNQRQNSGMEDLIIGSSSLELPVNFGRTNRKIVAFTQMTRLYVRPRVRVYGHKFSVTSYEVHIAHVSSTGMLEDDKLAEWYDRDKATEFLNWLVGNIVRSS